ncbi:MAG: MBL fold metallo-hydrolase [Fidelibacterota bacterium]
MSATDSREPDVPASLESPPGLRIRWLGSAGYEISDDSTTILVDPFVSRPGSFQLLHKVGIDTGAVDRYILSPVQQNRVKVILISHSHYDHVEDIPYILAHYPDRENRPLVVGDPNTQAIIRGYRAGMGIPWIRKAGGLQDTPMRVLDFPGDKISYEVGLFGDFTIRAYRSEHPMYDFLPWEGPEGTVTGTPPYTILDYKLYDTLSIGYLIQHRDFRLFISETPLLRHPQKVGPVDILILGIAARKRENTIPESLAALRPRIVIPTHYDNLFKPLREFHRFDYIIGFPPDFIPRTQKRELLLVDFSRFPQFLTQFDTYFVPEARGMIGEDTLSFDPRLRLMKLLYYYSLEGLVSGVKQ